MLKSQRPSHKEQLQQQVKADELPTKRLNAVIEAELYRRIKMRSAQEGRSISDLTRKLWIEYLSK
jgi:hypothetical protein